MKALKFTHVAPLGLALLLLSACAPVTREAAAAHSAAPAAHGAAHWGYTGDTGPEYWGELNPDYVLCATGESQSPIDIKDVNEVDLANFEIHYEPSEARIINNGHTIEAIYGEGSYIVLDGVRYNLDQFHFHAPSEHTINGKNAAMEGHFVNKSEDGQVTVVAVLFEVGPASDALAALGENLTMAETPEAATPVQVNAADLLPADHSIVRYTGSLTTPPCTQGVNWVIMVQPQVITEEQLAAFTQYYDGNHRPVQPLNGRVIQEDMTP